MTYEREAAPVKVKPLENVKPKVGLVVRLDNEPGRWQITSRAPKSEGASAWWLSPYDDLARMALPHPKHGAYRSGTWRTMRAHNDPAPA